jgi:hypothetical protein
LGLGSWDPYFTHKKKGYLNGKGELIFGRRKRGKMRVLTKKKHAIVCDGITMKGSH